MMDVQFLVSVRCMTYNQAAYIEDALNGFVMQQTSFPFVCFIIDDSSTDSEQNVICRYLEQNFDLSNKSVVRNEVTDDYVMKFARHKDNKNCYFAVFYLKYNHYSSQQLKYKKLQYIEELEKQVKYIAICEGDDYWIDPYKLQKQVDLLRNDIRVSMCCNKTARFSMKQNEIIGYISASEEDCILSPHDVVMNSGGYIATCSMLIKASIITDNYPEYCKNCHVGDYPLQIMCAMKGKISYLSDIMSVYRCENPLSWCGRFYSDKLTDIRLRGLSSEIKMLSGFSNDYLEFKGLFEKRIRDIIIKNVPIKKDNPEDYFKYSLYFKHEIDNFGIIIKCLYLIYASPLRKILRTIRIFFTSILK